VHYLHRLSIYVDECWQQEGQGFPRTRLKTDDMVISSLIKRLFTVFLLMLFTSAQNNYLLVCNLCHNPRQLELRVSEHDTPEG